MIRSLLLLVLAAPCFAQGLSRIAGGVVQSDEWIIRRELKEEEFKSNVRFDHGSDHVQADWALYQKKLELWTVRGHLFASRTLPNGDLYEVWGHEAIYHMDTKDGRGSGGKSPIRFKRSFTVDGATTAWNGTADTARWDGAAKRATLEGGVRVDGDDLGIRSQTAMFDQERKQGAFEGGRPVAHFGDDRFLSACQADRVTLQDAPRRVAAEGGVQGWLVLRKRDGTHR